MLMTSFPRPAFSCLLLCLFLSGFSVCGIALPQDSTSFSVSSPVILLPSPKYVELRQGHFAFTPEVRIHIRESRDADDLFAATQLSDEAQRDLGIRLRQNLRLQGRSVVIGRIESDKEIQRSLGAIEHHYLDSLGGEGYVVHVTPERIVVAARTSAGIFYGVQTLKQLLRANRSGASIPCVTIVDWPSLRYRGWMHDISRGPIPTMDFLKRIIETMAEYKQNYFTLYTENVFRLRSHPDVSPVDGITAEEVAELSSFARKYHIELIGNAQSFGHMEHILASPFYASMRENAWVVSPAVEETYSFLEQMYAEIIPAYSSTLFHINCDEVTGLGAGPGKRLVDSLGAGGVYAYHINRVSDIIRPYGKRILMWGDIAASNPEIVARLPKDLVIISWGYGADESFVNAILPFKKTGFDFMVAPGVGCWNQVWPGMTTAMTNISNYVRDGAALGTMGMMNTVWDDDGENLFHSNWHGLVWGAECSWDPARPLPGSEADTELEAHKRVFNTAFDSLFFGISGVTPSLFQFDSLRALPVRNLVTDQGVWSSVLQFHSEDVDSLAFAMNNRIIRDVGDLLERLVQLRGNAKWNKEMIDAAVFAARRVVFTGKKNLARITLARTMETPTPANVDQTKGILRDLLEELHQLKEVYVGLWERENRSWWLDRVLAKYDRLGSELLDIDNVVSIKADNVLIDGKRLVHLSTPFADQNMIYTTDGAEPTVRSTLYTEPFPIDRSSLIRAKVFIDGQVCPMAEQYIMVHKAIGKLSKLNSQYSRKNPNYAAGGPMGLLDGLRGSDDFSDGRWQGYEGQDLNIVLDLQKPTDVSRISIGCLQSSYSWILMPAKIEIWISDDGEKFTLARELPNTIDPRADGTIVHDFTAEFGHLSTRFVKVIAKSPGKLPAWHHAAGGDAFIFADEIVVE